MTHDVTNNTSSSSTHQRKISIDISPFAEVQCQNQLLLSENDVLYMMKPHQTKQTRCNNYNNNRTKCGAISRLTHTAVCKSFNSFGKCIRACSSTCIRSMKAILMQETTPELLSLSIAVGVAIGVFPLPGCTFLLVSFVGLMFKRLNMPAMQVVNAIITPVELAMIIPHLRIGEFLVRRESAQQLDLNLFVSRLREDFVAAMGEFGSSLGLALLGWIVCLPFMIALLHVMQLPLIKIIIRRVKGV